MKGGSSGISNSRHPAGMHTEVHAGMCAHACVGQHSSCTAPPRRHVLHICIAYKEQGAASSAIKGNEMMRLRSSCTALS